MRQTNQNGQFVFVNVRPGPYTLTVELAGMKTIRVSRFVVGVNETHRREDIVRLTKCFKSIA